MKKVALLVVSVVKLSAQDPIFTTVHNAPVSLSPSFVGSNESIRVNSLYRGQWRQLSGSYLTYYLSGDAFIQKTKGGIGISFIGDDQARGTIVTNELNFSYAQHLSFGKEKQFKLSPSIQAGYFTKTLDLTKLTFPSSNPSHINTSTGKDETKITKGNLRLNGGLLFNSKNFYAGFAVFNINQPDEGVFGPSKRPLRISAHTSYNFILSESSLLHVFANYQKQQSFEYYQMAATALFNKHLLLGAGYKYGNSPFIMLGYKGKNFTAVFDYERYFSALSASSVDAFELSLRFSFKKDSESVFKAIETW